MELVTNFNIANNHFSKTCTTLRQCTKTMRSKFHSARNVASHRIAQNIEIGQEGHRDNDKGKHKGIQLFQIVLKKL